MPATSDWPSYMISLMTTGPTSGPALGAPPPSRKAATEPGVSTPKVRLANGTNCVPEPSITRPTETPLAMGGIACTARRPLGLSVASTAVR